MRITHVVTLVSDDGAYGGPVSVATGQLGELASRGHEVELVSLWRGRRRPHASVDGVPLRAVRARTLVPGQGFLGLFHPGLLPALWRRAGRADVWHIHAGRDLVSLAALAVAVVRRRPFLVQTHGMVQPRRSAMAAVFDGLYVPCCAGRAPRWCSPTRKRQGCAGYWAGTGRVWSGSPTGCAPAPTTTESSETDVLFLARLQTRKRPEAFVRMAALVHRKRPEVSFTLHGSDEGRLAEVRRLIAERGARRRGDVRRGAGSRRRGASGRRGPPCMSCPAWTSRSR